jgi:hypothetical protein
VKGEHAFGVLDWGVGRRMMRGMSDGEKISSTNIMMS